MRLLGILAALFASSWGMGGAGLAPPGAPMQQNLSRDNLVAPIYPGAIEVESWTGGSTTSGREAETSAFLSKDPLAKVRSFYEGELGPLQSLPLTQLERPDPDPDADTERPNIAAIMVMTPDQVYEIGVAREYHGSSAGIEIRFIEPEQGRRSDQYPSVGPFFQKAQVAMLGGEASSEDYLALVEKYQHLAWLYYPRAAAETTGDGDGQTMDEVLFNDCENRTRAGMSGEEAAIKIRQLLVEGKAEEAQELMNKLAGAGGTWDTWVECLGELEEYGYETLILIDQHPSLWE